MIFSKVFLSADHTGDLLINLITSFLQSKGVDYEVMKNEALEDYSHAAKKVAKKVLEFEESCGILVCGSGVGISIAANRFKNIRAGVCYSVETAKIARRHNNLNILCLGARVLPPEEQLLILEVFLNEKFEGGRHEVRIQNIDKI